MNLWPAGVNILPSRPFFLLLSLTYRKNPLILQLLKPTVTGWVKDNALLKSERGCTKAANWGRL
jgi:hypothetical protein